MLELIINSENDKNKVIVLTENGKAVELYRENEKQERLEGNIYIGQVRDIIPGMQAAFVDIGTGKNSFIHLKDILPKVDEKVKNKANYEEIKDIKNVIRPKDKLLVQIKKDSNDKKGARVSTHINLPSRYLVFTPNASILTISQKITDSKERSRLLQIIKSNLPEGTGAIIRTSAEGKSVEDIVSDLKYTINMWNKILEKYHKDIEEQTKLIYQSPSIVEKMIIDLLDKGLTKIVINDENEYSFLKEKLKEKEEYKLINLELRRNEDLLNIYDIETQIKKGTERKVWLNCGGFITIDKTEALTAIDVNTGKYTGNKSLEETVFKVNYEATLEIAKQIRLRDIGGIIIIDYIDMSMLENKEKIQKLLEEALKKDRAKTQIEGFTKLDLMELTRKHICSHNEE